MTTNNKIFQSTKTYCHNVGLSACFRQWRATSHCKYLHGYALQVKLVFEGSLDEKNWVQGFGDLKPVKAWLENTFDHKTLIARDDPNYADFVHAHQKGIIQMVTVEATGCEKFAEMIYDQVLGMGFDKLIEVEVREHEGNSAICKRDIFQGIRNPNN